MDPSGKRKRDAGDVDHRKKLKREKKPPPPPITKSLQRCRSEPCNAKTNALSSQIKELKQREKRLLEQVSRLTKRQVLQHYPSAPMKTITERHLKLQNVFDTEGGHGCVFVLQSEAGLFIAKQEIDSNLEIANCLMRLVGIRVPTLKIPTKEETDLLLTQLLTLSSSEKATELTRTTAAKAHTALGQQKGLLLLEYIHGHTMEDPQFGVSDFFEPFTKCHSLSNQGRQMLRDMGKCLGVDIFLNNHDHLPLEGIWTSKEGNLGNFLISTRNVGGLSASPHLVSIDHAGVGFPREPAKQKAYFKKVLDVVNRMLANPQEESPSIRSARVWIEQQVNGVNGLVGTCGNQQECFGLEGSTEIQKGFLEALIQILLISSNGLLSKMLTRSSTSLMISTFPLTSHLTPPRAPLSSSSSCATSPAFSTPSTSSCPRTRSWPSIERKKFVEDSLKDLIDFVSIGTSQLYESVIGVLTDQRPHRLSVKLSVSVSF